MDCDVQGTPANYRHHHDTSNRYAVIPPSVQYLGGNREERRKAKRDKRKLEKLFRRISR